MKRILGICCAYAAFVLVVCLCVGFFSGTLPELLPDSAAAYKWIRSLLFFCDVLPAALISASVVAYAVVFSRQDKKPAVRFSPVMFERFRTVAFSALYGVAAIIFAQELASPLLTRSLHEKERAPALYREYLAAAETSAAGESFTVALQYALSAQHLYPRSDAALRLRELCELKLGGYPVKSAVSDTAIPGADLPAEGDNGSSYELLTRARLLYGQQSWLDAHYYASLAYAFAEAGSANANEAKILASDAWNRIEETERSEDPAAERLFARKKAAYRMLMSGDVLQAYYAFGSLSEAYADDPDVDRYYRIASAEMAKKYFFFDEIPVSRIFEDTEDMYFSVPRPNGGFFAVYIRGVASARQLGGLVQYLRSLTVYAYTRNGTFEFSFYVPCAKMVAQSVSVFDAEFQKKLGLSGKNIAVPYIMLESTDRSRQTSVQKPVFTFADGAASYTELAECNYLVLPMPFQEFLLLKNVSLDSSDMVLTDLFRFAGKAPGYGFSREVYGQAACFRACRPVYYLALFILTAVLGWNYRIVKNRQFRFSWLFPIPLFTAVAYAVLQAAGYCGTLFNYGLISLFGVWAAPMILGIALVSVFAAAVLFVSRHDA